MLSLLILTALSSNLLALGDARTLVHVRADAGDDADERYGVVGKNKVQ
jgi:hypothetical protein